MGVDPILPAAILLQLLAGIVLAVVGFVMTVAQPRMGPPEGRWPLSRKIAAARTAFVLFALLQGVALAALIVAIP